MMTRQDGFTLIEMVVAITVSAVVVGFMALFLTSPVEAYFSQERRTELADSANSARRMFANDIHNALPDSVRAVTSGTNRALELLQVTDMARYRPTPSSGNALQDLQLGPPGDQDFSLFGVLATLPTSVNVCTGRLAIGRGNAYAVSNVITPAGMCFTLAPPDAIKNEQAVHLAAPFAFTAAGSPSATVYYVKQPVSYVCDLTANTLKRFEGYPISANQASHATEAQLIAQGASMSLVARDVTACTFQYSSSLAGGPLARLRLTFSRNGETLQVFEQVQVENQP